VWRFIRRDTVSVGEEPETRRLGLLVPVGVSYLAPTCKILCVFRALEGVRGGRKIYTCSDRTFLYLVTGGLRYHHH
jgi:hypothetical protein